MVMFHSFGSLQEGNRWVKCGNLPRSMGDTQNGCFVMENPSINGWWLGVPSISGNLASTNERAERGGLSCSKWWFHLQEKSRFSYIKKYWYWFMYLFCMRDMQICIELPYPMGKVQLGSFLPGCWWRREWGWWGRRLKICQPLVMTNSLPRKMKSSIFRIYRIGKSAIVWFNYKKMVSLSVWFSG